jgi:hypothetical protein
LTFKRGAELTISAPTPADDPDGPNGPLYDGMKVKLAPVFTELRPVIKSDCSQGLKDEASDIKNTMTLPVPLANPSDADIRSKIGSVPNGIYPVLVQFGEKT